MKGFVAPTSKHHSMKVFEWHGVPHILDLDTEGRWMVILLFQYLYPWENSPWYPMVMRLGESPEPLCWC